MLRIKVLGNIWGWALLFGLMAACSRPLPSKVVVALEDDVVSLDPHAYDDEVTSVALANIYQPLVGFDSQMRIVPILAQSWENPNDLTWRFRLRPGVRFHNGKALDAQDVVFSLKRTQRGRLAYHLGQVASVRAMDESTVEITTRQPAPILLNKLNFIAIVPQGCPDSIAHPLGTGPYCFVEHQVGRSLILRANPDYWGPKPRIAEAELRAIPTPEGRLEALKRGEIHLAKFVPRHQPREDKKSEVCYVSLPGLGVTLLGINVQTKGPLADRRVRQAIYWAIDPQRVIQENDLAATPNDQLVAPFVVGYIPGGESKRPQTARARELLKQAGYASGFRTTIEVSTSAASRAQSLARQLQEVGIELEVVPREWSELNERLERRQAAFYLIGWSCVSGDASDLLEACLHSGRRPGYGLSNWSRYQDAEMDDLIERAGRTLDQRQRILYLQKALRRGLEEMPLIPLYVRSQTYAHCRRLVFQPHQDGTVPLAELSFTR